MRRLAACLLLPLVSLAVVAAPAPEPAAEPEEGNDAKTIVGTWEAVRGVKEGVPAPPKEIQGLKMVFTADTLTVQEPGRLGRPESVGYKLNPKAKPRQIDLTLNFPGKGPVTRIEGIYKIEKGQLTICFTKNRGPRPMTFDEKTYTVLVMRKEKKK